MLWYIIGYFLIGAALAFGIQYWKGRGRHPNETNSVRDMEFDLLAAATFAIWPGVLGLGVAVMVLMVLAFPFIKISKFFENLGKKHRGAK